MTLTIGTQVHYRDRANRKRTGPIDKTSTKPGEKIYRVDGKRWFLREGLKVA